MSFFCNFTNDSDCSTLFEQVHLSYTIVHAILLIGTILTSVPINLLLIVTMVLYRKSLDKSIILAVSVLISNIIASLSLTGEMVVTSIARSWLFGYWGCQGITFIATCALFSRWITVGFIALDRFCRVFWTFTYPRHESKVIISLLVLSWIISVVISLILFFCKSFTFFIGAPGCFFVEYNPEMTLPGIVVTNALLWITRIIAIFVPATLYTMMYVKAYEIRKKSPAVTITDSPDAAAEEKNARSRANKASLTYSLMLIAFVVVNLVIVLKDILGRVFLHFNVSIDIAIPIGFLTTAIIQAYCLGDLAIILANRQIRKSFFTLLAKIGIKK